MKLTKIVFCLVLSGCILSSCIRENIDDCLSVNKLILSYKGDGTTEIFPDKIFRVEMFVFDAENKCVSSSVLPDEDVAVRTATLPPLQAGDYTIVCVGNTYDTKVDGISSGDFGKMIFAAGDYFDDRQVSGNDPLYHASIPYNILPFTGRRRTTRLK